MLRRLYPGVGVGEVAFSASSILFAGVLMAGTLIGTRTSEVPATHAVPPAVATTTPPATAGGAPTTTAGSVAPPTTTVRSSSGPAAPPAATVGVTSPTPTVGTPPPTTVAMAVRRARNRAGGLDHADDVTVCLVESPQQLLRRPCPR